MENTEQTDLTELLPGDELEQGTSDAEQTGENAAPPAEETAVETPTEDEQKTARTVPIEALEDERRKRQDLETRLNDFEQRLADKPQQPQQQPEIPDPFDDPAGYAQHQERQNHFNLRNSIANLSEAQTRRASGNELVDEALNAASKAGVASEFFNNAADPYGEMVDWFERQKINQEIGHDPNAYREKVRAEERDKVLKEYGLKTSQKDLAKPSQLSVPQSLASTPSAQGASQNWDGPPSMNQLLD